MSEVTFALAVAAAATGWLVLVEVNKVLTVRVGWAPFHAVAAAILAFWFMRFAQFAVISWGVAR